jgi:hypothetical protein
MKAFYPQIAELYGETIRELSAQGKTCQEIAAKISLQGSRCTGAVVRRAMIHLGVERVGNKGFREKNVQRVRLMTALYRNGYTLQQIGDQYNMTRERVRQLLAKYEGISANDGGFRLQAAQKRAERAKKADAACFRHRGCTVDQWKELLRVGREMVAAGKGKLTTPTRAYAMQRRNAAKRGIGWELSLWDWWTIWQQSGKWDKRGRGDGYVMARLNDEGPYAVGNVSIITAVENIVNGRRVKKYDYPKGVRRASNWSESRPRFQAERRVAGKTYYLGTYPTPDLAHAAYLAFVPSQDRAA